jgi:hypothetical protein
MYFAELRAESMLARAPKNQRSTASEPLTEPVA